MPNLETSYVFARWVADTGKALIEHYYGENYDLETGRFSPTDELLIPVEDIIPREREDLVYWLNGALMFIKTVARLFHVRLNEIDPDDVRLIDQIWDVDEI